MIIKSIWLRRVHKWVGIVIGLQFLLWAISGTAMALLEVSGLSKQYSGVAVLKAVFRMTESEALGVMLTAHRKGACVVAVFTQEVAETKAKQATDMGASAGFPLAFTTEREE